MNHPLCYFRNSNESTESDIKTFLEISQRDKFEAKLQCCLRLYLDIKDKI